MQMMKKIYQSFNKIMKLQLIKNHLTLKEKKVTPNKVTLTTECLMIHKKKFNYNHKNQKIILKQNNLIKIL